MESFHFHMKSYLNAQAYNLSKVPIRPPICEAEITSNKYKNN